MHEGAPRAEFTTQRPELPEAETHLEQPIAWELKQTLISFAAYRHPQHLKDEFSRMLRFLTGKDYTDVEPRFKKAEWRPRSIALPFNRPELEQPVQNLDKQFFEILKLLSTELQPAADNRIRLEKAEVKNQKKTPTARTETAHPFLNAAQQEENIRALLQTKIHELDFSAFSEEEVMQIMLGRKLEESDMENRAMLFQEFYDILPTAEQKQKATAEKRKINAEQRSTRNRRLTAA